MPDHELFVDATCGGGSVGLNKVPSTMEVWNDVDPALMNFWACVQGRADELRDIAGKLDYNEYIFQWAKQALVMCDVAPDPAYHALAFWVVSRFSRGGLGEDFAWSDRLRGKRSAGGPKPGDAHAWDTARERLPLIADRIKDVVLTCRDALDVIAQYRDDPEALIYFDPPYPTWTRTHKAAYRHEVATTREAEVRWHMRTLGGLCVGECKAMVAGYRNDLYMDLLKGWRLFEFPMPNHSGQGKVKNRRTECLWVKD
jgi:DNA adenine methylase